jgi:CheY-like chemotaxis protein
MNENNKHPEGILLVEDEEDHARLIMKGLKERGRLVNDIVWLKNGQDALDYIRKEGAYSEDTSPLPGLVLLDVKMPIKNGFEVLEELKVDNRYKHIPVVMLTTTSETADIQKAMNLGANDYIVKPVKFSEFTEKISSIGHYWVMISDASLVMKL